MDYHAFLATLERYNGFVEKQHDDDFGRTTALRAPINEGPFYAIQIAPGVHHTMGGVTINTETCVLDSNHNVLPGAFEKDVRHLLPRPDTHSAIRHFPRRRGACRGYF